MSKSLQITIMYFASLADIAGRDIEKMNIDFAMTLPELYEKLAETYGFTATTNQLRVAINDNFTQWSDNIHDGDHIAFIPPVAGG